MTFIIRSYLIYWRHILTATYLLTAAYLILNASNATVGASLSKHPRVYPLL